MSFSMASVLVESIIVNGQSFTTVPHLLPFEIKKFGFSVLKSNALNMFPGRKKVVDLKQYLMIYKS